ncbi:MAG: arsenate reductase ArsC [Euryarchaeota archaeon]|nr:arsenate reductase ArsC [Euryarchaeota archaeon]
MWILINVEKKKVLFICNRNAGRSQMAEGLLNDLYGDRFQAYSAGIRQSTISPYTIKVMDEIGVDISKNRSKSIDEFQDMEFDCVVTVCDNAEENCSFFPNASDYIHKNFKDPSKFKGEKNQILDGFRGVRDEVKIWIEKKFGIIN